MSSSPDSPHPHPDPDPSPYPSSSSPDPSPSSSTTSAVSSNTVPVGRISANPNPSPSHAHDDDDAAAAAAAADADADADVDRPQPSLLSTLRSNPSFMSEYGLARIFLAGAAVAWMAAIGLYIAVYSNTAFSYGLYLLVLSTFHTLEFLITALAHPGTVSFSSTCLDQSREYHLAVIGSLIEYWLEYFLFPKSPFSLTSDTSSWLSFCITLSFSIGVVLTVGGQVLRTTAMYQAGANFTHRIRNYKQKEHRLVTEGVYAWFRHPSYVGWFWWSIGTQLLLCNPVCTLVYIYVSWRFFAIRIPYEEQALFAFFGQEYHQYHARVGTGIPGIKTTTPHKKIQ